jgi:hypothetical protein
LRPASAGQHTSCKPAKVFRYVPIWPVAIFAELAGRAERHDHRAGKQHNHCRGGRRQPMADRIRRRPGLQRHAKCRAKRAGLSVYVLDRLQREAQQRGTRTDKLAEAILRAVATDDLFTAIIDR